MREEPPPDSGTSEAAQFAAFLRFYRSTIVEKARSLSDGKLREPALPSSWTALELVHHLACMERRWLVWDFLGEPVEDPWADSAGDPDGPWAVPAGASLDEVVALLDATAARTEEVLDTTGMDTLASTYGRFSTDKAPPDLRWVCFHVLQEYARHAGHLDAAVEILGGHVGE